MHNVIYFCGMGAFLWVFGIFFMRKNTIYFL